MVISNGVCVICPHIHLSRRSVSGGEIFMGIYLSLWMKDEVLAERMDGRMYGTEAHHISAQDWTQNTSVCVGKRYINIHTYVYIHIHVANDD